MNRLILTAVFALASALTFVSEARAQDIVLLVSERTSDDAPPAFWWAETQPAFSAFDQTLADGLKLAGTFVSLPQDLSQVSRIYRRPDLSDASAVTFAGIVGARSALVGEVSMTRLAPLGPLRLQGVELTMEARLVKRAKNGNVRVTARYVVTEVAFGANLEEAEKNVRERVVGQIAPDIARATRVLPVGEAGGPPSSEVLIAIRDAADPLLVDIVRRGLAERPDIDAVVPAWFGTGTVGLEVNPGVEDEAAFIEKVAGEFAARTDLGIRLIPVAEPRAGTVEFRVEKLAEAE